MPTSFSKESKPTTSFSKVTKPLTIFTKAFISFLLKEDTFFLLLETGDKIILADTRPTTSYTKESKP